ncbi:MAG: DUF6868 family protein [Paracoccaceae bacterium]
MTVETLTQFFGWATVLNFALLTCSGAAVIFFRDGMMRMHSKMLGIEEKALPPLYFGWLAQFKVLALITSFVPWLALKLM